MSGLFLAVLLFFTLNVAVTIFMMCGAAIAKREDRRMDEMENRLNVESALAKLRII